MREKGEREREIWWNEEEGSKPFFKSRPAGAWAPRLGRLGARPPEAHFASAAQLAPRRPVFFFFSFFFLFQTPLSYHHILIYIS